MSGDTQGSNLGLCMVLRCPQPGGEEGRALFCLPRHPRSSLLLSRANEQARRCKLGQEHPMSD